MCLEVNRTLRKRTHPSFQTKRTQAESEPLWVLILGEYEAGTKRKRDVNQGADDGRSEEHNGTTSWEDSTAFPSFIASYETFEQTLLVC